jgi:hypothetical protein
VTKNRPQQNLCCLGTLFSLSPFPAQILLGFKTVGSYSLCLQGVDELFVERSSRAIGGLRRYFCSHWAVPLPVLHVLGLPVYLQILAWIALPIASMGIPADFIRLFTSMQFCFALSKFVRRECCMICPWISPALWLPLAMAQAIFLSAGTVTRATLA